ncbi:DNA polymerase I [Fusobacterium russii]|uniref:DNA polymerase I n=1 Tax=Fusobacterium russii TaxID=854 RepID=UPI00039CA817|nr:DNA polymerase I [Fusobacterium russii]
MKKAVLLDVSAIMYRAYFANLNFRTKNEPTGAVYGFMNTFMSILKEFNPDYVAAAFDVKRASLKRTEIFGEYKSNRESAPEDLIRQIPRIEELLDCFNVKRYKIEGYEADDILGSLAKKLAEQDIEVYIVTGDKDLSQLVEKNINIALLGKGNEGEKFGILKNEEDVVNYLGVKPDKIPDLFGLIGDKSDGIPGITKIGEKKALALLSKYDSLEKIYENIEDLKNIDGIGPSLIKNICNEKDLAFMSRELAKISADLNLDIKIENLNFEMDKFKLYKLFKELEFKMFIKKLNLESEQIQESLFRNLSNSDVIIEDKNSINLDKKVKKTTEILLEEREFTIIDDVDLLEKERIYFNNYVEKFASIYFEEAGIALSTKDRDFYFPLFHEGLLVKNIEKEILADFLKNLDINFISYNIKNILNLNFDFKNNYSDLMISYHLISSQTKVDPFLPISEYSELNLQDFKSIFGRQSAKLISGEDYGKYLTRISLGLLLICDELDNILEENDLKTVLEDIENPLIKVLSYMEKNGIKIDKEYFKNYSLELELELGKIEKLIYEEAGETFNINSPKQLGEILFEKMNLPSGKKTKTGFSTDVSVLEDLEYGGFNIAKLILDYRKLNKLKNTYVDTLPTMTDSGSRIHTTFNQIGTVTGRLSSSDPNLQNIPVKTEDGIKIREGFIADKGKKLLSIDYSQVELRVLASLSKDENLVKAYKEGKDLHKLTAQKIFSLAESDEVSREQRIIAKIINFSIIYGKTAFGLSKELKIPVKDASEYINKYFEQYSRVASFEREIIEFAEENGFVKTLFGRKRLINGINSKNKNIKSQAERMAINTVIQGTAAEILKKVMIKIYDILKDKQDIKLLLQVHDELIFEVEDNSIEKYSNILSDIMTKTVSLEDVNLEININIGKNWAEAK